MKTQQEAISYLLIFLVAIALISTIIFYYLPYIRKSEEKIRIKNIFERMFNKEIENSVVNALKSILQGESSKRVDIGYDVIWTFSSNSIEAKFLISSDPPSIPNDEWIFLEGCNKDVCYIGLDLFYKAEIKSKRVSNGYEVSYRLSLPNNLKSEDKNLNIVLIPEKQTFSSKQLVFTLIKFERRPAEIYYEIKVSA
jgi:hypothetical protein